MHCIFYCLIVVPYPLICAMKKKKYYDPMTITNHTIMRKWLVLNFSLRVVAPRNNRLILSSSSHFSLLHIIKIPNTGFAVARSGRRVLPVHVGLVGRERSSSSTFHLLLFLLFFCLQLFCPEILCQNIFFSKFSIL